MGDRIWRPRGKTETGGKLRDEEAGGETDLETETKGERPGGVR